MCSKEWESQITLISPPSPPGQRIVVVRCEKINISGSFYRNKCKYMCIYMACECVSVGVGVGVGMSVSVRRGLWVCVGHGL